MLIGNWSYAKIDDLDLPDVEVNLNFVKSNIKDLFNFEDVEIMEFYNMKRIDVETQLGTLKQSIDKDHDASG